MVQNDLDWLPTLTGSPRQVARGGGARWYAINGVLKRLEPVAQRWFALDAGLVAAECLPILADRIRDTGAPGSDLAADLVQRFFAVLTSERAARYWIDRDGWNGNDWFGRLMTPEEHAARRAAKNGA